MKRFSFIVGLGLLLISASRSWAETLDVTPSTRTLTLPDAIQLAIQNNLTVKLAQAQTEEARGKAIQDAASLLPQLTAGASESHVFKFNLESEGFPANSAVFPSLIGPFNTFDARFKLAQNFLNLNAWWKMEAGRANQKAAHDQEQLAREQVAAAAALAYLEAQRTMRAVAAAQSDFNLSNTLLKLSNDQKSAGISTGIDVARSQTTAAQEHLRLIRAQVAVQEADLALKRVVGIALDVPLDLPKISDISNDQLPSVHDAISAARANRAEILLAQARLDADRLSLKSKKAEHYPILAGNADYGYSGTIPSNVARTGSIGGSLTLPIFSGGMAHGDVVEANGHVLESESRLLDTRAQVEEDIRLALQTLHAEIDEVQTAQEAAQLAQKELVMARDRFAAGVGDNIQLLTAEDALDRASADQVDATARLDTARVNLATALGQAQQFK